MSRLLALPWSRIATYLLLVATIALTACQTMPEHNDWLYRQLGGRKGISAIDRTLLLTIAKDDRINDIFKDADIVRLHRLLTEQFCVLAGGPCTYTGADMVEAHRYMGLTSADFNALVEDLIHAMDAHDIPTAAQNRLLAQLAPMRRDVVDEHPLPPDSQSPATASISRPAPD